jgi:hypothetical protein
MLVNNQNKQLLGWGGEAVVRAHPTDPTRVLKRYHRDAGLQLLEDTEFFVQTSNDLADQGVLVPRLYGVELWNGRVLAEIQKIEGVAMEFEADWNNNTPSAIQQLRDLPLAVITKMYQDMVSIGEAGMTLDLGDQNMMLASNGIYHIDVFDRYHWPDAPSKWPGFLDERIRGDILALEQYQLYPKEELTQLRTKLELAYQLWSTSR